VVIKQKLNFKIFKFLLIFTAYFLKLVSLLHYQKKYMTSTL